MAGLAADRRGDPQIAADLLHRKSRQERGKSCRPAAEAGIVTGVPQRTADRSGHNQTICREVQRN
jgi:hypothetical protein